MSPLPDLTNTTIFPIFTSIPISSPSPSPLTENATSTQLSSSTSGSTNSNVPLTYYLMATITENMTLSTNPTFICKDRINVPFALTILLPPALHDSQKYMGKFDDAAFKKGFTVVVRDALRVGVREGKQGFVEVELGDVKVIPTSVEKLIVMSRYERAQGEVDSEMVCAACGKGAEEGRRVLARCIRCQGVWYCDKICQVKGWSENGHKSECKVLKAVGEVFGT